MLISLYFKNLFEQVLEFTEYVSVSLVTTYDSITECVTIDLFLAGLKNSSTVVKLFDAGANLSILTSVFHQHLTFITKFRDF